MVGTVWRGLSGEDCVEGHEWWGLNGEEKPTPWVMGLSGRAHSLGVGA